MRVKFIVTGDLEKLALVDSLSRFFPFLRTGEAIEYLQARQVQGGATTTSPLPVPSGILPKP